MTDTALDLLREIVAASGREPRGHSGRLVVAAVPAELIDRAAALLAGQPEPGAAPVDHRATAQAVLARLDERIEEMTADQIQAAAAVAQVHAALAAGTPVAGQHVSAALRELRAAVRDLSGSDDEDAGFVELVLPAAAWAKVQELTR